MSLEIQKLQNTQHVQDHSTSEFKGDPTKKGLHGAFPNDSISMQPTKEEFMRDLLKMPLEPPKTSDLRRPQDDKIFYSAMHDLFDAVEEVRKETGMTVEQILHEVLKENQEIKEENSKEENDRFKSYQDESRKIHAEKMKVMLDAIKRAEKTEFWGYFQKGINAIQTFLSVGTGAAMCATGNPGAIALGAFVIGDALDGLLGDPLKSSVIKAATYYLPIEEETKKKVNSYSLEVLKLAIMAVEVGIMWTKSVELTTKIAEILAKFGSAVTLGEAGVKGMQAKHHWDKEGSDKVLSKLQFDATENDENRRERVKNIQGMFESYLADLQIRRKFEESNAQAKHFKL